jgi:hypothetical protein
VKEYKTIAESSGPEKNTVGLLLNHLVSNYGFWPQADAAASTTVETQG